MWIAKPEGFYSITKSPDGRFEICAPKLRDLAELLRKAGLTGILRHTSTGEKIWGISVESDQLPAIFSVLIASLREGEFLDPDRPAGPARDLEGLLLSMMPRHHEDACCPVGSGAIKCE